VWSGCCVPRFLTRKFVPPKHDTSLSYYTASHPRGRFIVTTVRTSDLAIVSLWKPFQVYLVVSCEVCLKYKLLVEREFTSTIRLGVYKCHCLTAPFLGLFFLAWKFIVVEVPKFWSSVTVQTKSITLLHLWTQQSLRY
jgi:hypothetical protein